MVRADASGRMGRGSAARAHCSAWNIGAGAQCFDLPVRLFQGQEDPIIAAQSTRDLHRKFEDAGVAARYFEFPGVRHDIWNAAYRNGAIFDWFAQEKRNRYPERVSFVADSYRYCSAYWVRIDGLRSGHAGVDRGEVEPAHRKSPWLPRM